MSSTGIWQDGETRPCFCDGKPRTQKEYREHLKNGTHNKNVGK